MYQTGRPSNSCHVVENRLLVGGKPCGLAVSELLTFPGVSPEGVKVVVIHRLAVIQGVPHPSVYVHAREQVRYSYLWGGCGGGSVTWEPDSVGAPSGF